MDKPIDFPIIYEGSGDEDIEMVPKNDNSNN